MGKLRKICGDQTNNSEIYCGLLMLVAINQWWFLAFCHQLWLIILYSEIICAFLWFIGWYVTDLRISLGYAGFNFLVSPGFLAWISALAGENPQETHGGNGEMPSKAPLKTNSGIGMEETDGNCANQINAQLQFLWLSHGLTIETWLSQTRIATYTNQDNLNAEFPPNQPRDFMDQDDSKLNFWWFWVS